MANRSRTRWIVLGAVALLLGGALVGLNVAAAVTADKLNGVYPRSKPFVASKETRALHDRLTIADLHADPLLWSRDLNERSKTGHIDVPRLVDGNVALQVFGVVTKTPRKMNTDKNDDSTDNIALLAVAQRWPPRTWTSLKERALYQAQRLRELADASGGKLTLIRSGQELEAFLSSREKDRAKVAGVLALEGMHALEGNVENVDALFDAGFRILAPAHFFDNEVGGSAHGVKKGGLTEEGRAVIRRMEEKKIIVDLAHASKQTFADVLAMATRPVIVSHTGVKGTCDNARNLSDDQLRAVSKNGGVVGIGYWQIAVCGKDAKAIARAIRYAVNVAGIDHVALGSDFDGAVHVPFDVAGLPELTEALVAQGFTEAELQKVMGGNALRLLRENLP